MIEGEKVKDINFKQMQQMQTELQGQYKDKWPELEPSVAREKLLWMMIEAGEIADIIKKSGDAKIMSDSETRSDFIEEVCDTLMYLNDVLLCYDITPEELTEVYTSKFKKNMNRW